MLDGQTNVLFADVPPTAGSASFDARRFGRRLIAGLAGLNLLVLLLAGTAIWRGHENAEAYAVGHARNHALVYAQQVSNRLLAIDVALTAIGRRIQGQLAGGALDPADLGRFVGATFPNHDGIDRYAYVDANGAVAASVDYSSSPVSNIVTRDYFLRLRDDPAVGLMISRPLVGEVTGRTRIVLARRVNGPDNGFAGIVLAALDVAPLAADLAGFDVGPHSLVSLRGADFAVIARFPPIGASDTPEPHVGTPAEGLAVLRAAPDAGAYAGTDGSGEQRMFVYHRIGTLPLYVAIALLPTDYLGAWREDVVTIGGLVVAILLVSTGFGLVVTRLWQRRERDTATILALSERSHADIRARLDVALESAGMGSWSINRRTGDFQADARTRALGIGVAERLAERVSKGETGVEAPVAGSDGSLRWLAAHGRPVGNDGDDQVVGVLRDVTPNKAQERRMEAMERHVMAALGRLPIAAFMQDRDLRYTWILSGRIGLTPEQVIGHTDAELLPAESSGPIVALKRGVIASGEPAHGQVAIALPDQPTAWFDLYLEPEHNAQGEVRGLFGIAVDITDHYRQTDDLRAARQEAERAVETRSRFLAAASHDLRQPITALVLLLETIRPLADSEAAQHSIALMDSSLSALNSLLTSIVDISRLDAGVTTATLGTVDLSALLRRLVDEYRWIAEDRHLRLRAVLPTMFARTDRVLVDRVLRNLIENALRFTPKGGVVIGLRRRGDRVRIDIVDSGIGITGEQRPHIFDEFYQAANVARDHREGLGLGLAVVARLTQLLGGDIEVATRPGRGSRFSVLLPAAAPAAAAPAVVAVARTGGCLLVIEDNVLLLEGLQALLQIWGYRTHTASTGEAALEVWQRHGGEIDAVVADHRLGAGLTGTQTCQELVRRTGRRLPCLILTGDTDPERIAEVHASGFALMHKPPPPTDLQRALADLMA